ncbi:hypothetical protein KAX02_02890 [candidate division WOR-3 bacterium]|nr:hypothetical protein [candidate division WOR-3 bacterium]
MIDFERIRLEKQMDAGTEIEKAFLNDYLENRSVPEKYIDYCKRWSKAFAKWDSLSDMP